MTDTSARFALPYILPGQAQKESFHNEALALLDAALHPCVENGPSDDVPADPAPGQSWIVGTAAEGEWAGKAGQVACWSGSGWRFLLPVPGMAAWNLDAGYWLHWTGTGWSNGEWPVSRVTIDGQQVVGARLEAVSSPSGGTIIDVEARAALNALIVAMKTHGLIE